MGLLDKDVHAPIRPNRIGEQLPYFEYEDKANSDYHGYYLLKDGSLGIAWKVAIPPSYSYDQGYIQTNNEFRTFVESVPMGYEVQITVTSHNNLTEKMKRYLSLESGTEKGKILRHSRAEKLLDAGFNGYQVSDASFTMLRDTYMVITLRSPTFIENLGLLATVMESLFQLFATLFSVVGLDLSQMLDGFLTKMVRENMAEFSESVMSAESTLNEMFSIGSGSRMDPAELKDHYWTMYAPSYKEPGQKISVDPHVDLNDQMFPLPIEQDFDMIKLGSDYHGLVMMAIMPDSVGPDYLGVIRRTLITQYTFFVNIAQANQMLERAALSVSSALRSRVATMFSKEEAAAFAEEASQVKFRMFDGRKILYIMCGVIVHGKSRKEVENKMLRMNSTFKKLSVVPDMERTMSLQGISYSFPLAWRNNYTKPFARTRRVLSDDLTDLLPFHGHWGGHEYPQAVYVNRDGEITFFDHTSPDFVNWHYAITGTSGSGKSFAVVDLTLQLFAAGVEKQFLMTIKDDYDRFAQTMGKLIIIDLDNVSSCINPFAGPITKHRLQQWSTALELMIQKGSDVEASIMESRLTEQIVQYAYELVPEGDVLRPTWIREAYFKFPYVSEEQRAIGFSHAELVGSYCDDGIYGKLFDGFPSITEDDKLVVFNLQNVLSEKISDVIINAIFTMLDNVMYMGDRAAKKHLLVDEMITMITSKGGAQVANQLKRAFRTYRSLNCMCGIASQNEEDLTTEVGQAIIGNITKRMVLKPRKEMIPLLMETLGLRSERHQANIESLETKPGFYSEFYLMSPSGEVVCRLITDKLTYALATTTPEDVSEIKRLRQDNGGDWWKATLQFSQIYPHGVRAAIKAARQQEGDAA